MVPVTTLFESVFTQQGVIYERRHLVGDAIRRLEGTVLEYRGLEPWVVAPYFGGHCQKPRVGALEFVETLHEVSEHNELEWMAHIFCELAH